MEFHSFLIQTINIFADVLLLLIFIRVILSWFQVRHSPFADFIFRSSDIVLLPIRKLMPPTGPFDFSPLIAFFLIQFLRSLLLSFLI